MTHATTPPDADPSAIREAIDAATAAPANDLPPRYRITVVAAARSNPGRAVGAYVVRLGTRTRLVAAGVPVDFVFKANGSGDVDLTAAREAAAAIISSRARPS